MKNHPPSPRTALHTFLLLAMFCLAGLSRAKSQTFPDPPATETGKVTVTLSPKGIASGWHFVGEKAWRNSGAQVSALQLGAREIEFRPVSNYIQPINRKIGLTSDKPTLSLKLSYYETSGGATGNLKVILQPDELAAATVPKAERAQWRLLGEGNDKWRDSGVARKLLPGNYLVQVKPVAGKTTPLALSVTVTANKTAKATVAYFDQDSTTGVQPQVVDYSSILDSSSSLPYAYVGQIRSSYSFGSGVVVLSNTVATAAHLVYDEDRLTYFAGVQWLFERYQGFNNPVPQIPRRVGILTDYASQRTIDDSPGELTDRSRIYDVAALYFLDSPGRNGFSGYQFANNNSSNGYLESNNLKTMVGYPLDGIPSADQAKIHATTPSNFLFTPNADINGLTAKASYSTTDFTSVGGAAGSPIFVRNNGGTYDCAALYLGSSTQTTVRAFNEETDTLFQWANNDGVGPNGGITKVDGPVVGTGSSPGAIKINIKPSKGRWKLGTSGPNRASGSTVSGLFPGTYTIHFTRVAGYQTPPPVSVVVPSGKLFAKNIKYKRAGRANKIPTP